MKIRAAQIDDVPAIERLSLETFPALQRSLPHLSFDTLLDALIRVRLTDPNPTEGIFVAEHEGEIIGIIFTDIAERQQLSWRAQWRIIRPLGLRAMLRMLWLFNGNRYRPTAEEAYFSGIAVKPGHRQRGLGDSLTAIAEEYSHQRGKRIACAFIADGNTASQRTLLGRGWVKVPYRSLIRRLWARKTRVMRYEKVL